MKRILLLALLTPTAAFAHPGHGLGLEAGFLHPLTGADHLLVMPGVGLRAALQHDAARRAIPLALLALGAAVGSGLKRLDLRTGGALTLAAGPGLAITG